MLTEISLGRPRIFNAAGSNRLSGSMHRVCGSAGPPERSLAHSKTPRLTHAATTLTNQPRKAQPGLESL